MKFIRAFLQNIRGRADEHKISYSQCGEDLIIDFIFLGLNILTPSYLDIGAYHPTQLSNTYLFYLRGSQGVCVEADPSLFAEMKRLRKRDTCLNVGVGSGQVEKADFYIMTTKTLNTFSKDEAERYQSYGSQKIEKVIQVPVVSVNTILEKYCDCCPDLVSIDVEGLESKILKGFDFYRFRPKVFCVETLTYTEDKSERKVTEIIDSMVAKGYFVYADTFINSIFVDRESWRNR